LTTVQSRVVLQPVGDLVLVPLQGPVNPSLLDELRQRVLEHLEQVGARGLVFDMAGVAVLDEHDFQGLHDVVCCADLMGAPVVFAGIQPGVAAGLTMLDVDARWIEAVRTVEQAMAVFA